LGPEGLCDARFNSSPAAIVFQLGFDLMVPV